MKEYEIHEICQIIKNAWIATFELASNHPEIIYFQETQLHVEFAHLLLTYLEKERYTPWEDLILAFDTPHFCFDYPGVIPWNLIGKRRIRPDIYIKPVRPEDKDQPKVWIELKSLANIRRRQDGTIAPNPSINAYNTFITEAIKYSTYAECFGSHDIFIYSGMYYHDSNKNEMCNELTQYNWTATKILNDDSLVRHFFEKIDPKTFDEWLNT
jgi:hypothetical protein